MVGFKKLDNFKLLLMETAYLRFCQIVLSGILIIFLLIPSVGYSKKQPELSDSEIFFPQMPPPKAIENEAYMMARNVGKIILEKAVYG